MSHQDPVVLDARQYPDAGFLELEHCIVRVLGIGIRAGILR